MDARRIRRTRTCGLRPSISTRARRLSSTSGRGNGVNAFALLCSPSPVEETQDRRKNVSGLRDIVRGMRAKPKPANRKEAEWKRVIRSAKAIENDDERRTPATLKALRSLGVS